MRNLALAMVAVLLVTGCAGLQKQEESNNAEYGPMAIRLSEFSSQVIYYYRGKKQSVPVDFDEKQFLSILRQMPVDQVNQQDVESMESKSTVKAHAVDSGFSVMLCDKSGRKLMEDFASPHDSECRFDLNRVEIKSWNEDKPCSFEENWRQFCGK